jgi:hypothetical protein
VESTSPIKLKFEPKIKQDRTFNFFVFLSLNIQIMRQIVSLLDKKEQKTKNSIDVKMNFEIFFNHQIIFCLKKILCSTFNKTKKYHKLMSFIYFLI